MEQEHGEAPEAAGTDADSDWAKALVQHIAEQIKHFRGGRTRRRGVTSAQQLADRCAELGYPIKQSVITKLENGYRPTISVPELLVLAAALEVPPVMLLAPVGHVDEVTPLPTTGPVPTIEALRWLRGDATLDNPPSEDRAIVELRAYLRADALAGELATLLSTPEGKGDETAIRKAVPLVRRDLREKRAELRRLGLEPPPVPSAFGDVDTPRPNEPVGSLSYVIGEEPAE